MVFLMSKLSRLLPLLIALLSLVRYNETLNELGAMTYLQEEKEMVIATPRTTKSTTDGIHANKKNSGGSSRNELLLIKPIALGMSNQLECIHSAATLAIQYNRTLLLNEYAYEPSVHQLRPVLFESLFDGEEENTVDYRLLGDVLYKSASRRCKKKVPWKPNRLRSSPVQDPFSNTTCIRLQCSWGNSDIVTPPETFPHSNDLFFPYHSKLQMAATEIVQRMKEQVARKDDSSFRFLSLQIRLGDRQTHPLFNCSNLSRYPDIFYKSMGSGRKTVSCASIKRDESNATEELSWPRFLQEISDSDSSFPFHMQDFDAIFVATNQPHLIRSVWDPPNLFMIDDFPSICHSLLLKSTASSMLHSSSIDPATKDNTPSGAVEILAVEQLILARSDVYVPSFPTSITELVLRLRSHERPSEAITTLELRNTYLEYLTRFSAF
mmetsp:Transcript_31971/g.52782  ORF Transcript_31971/g.52782 Transcript_31971/m.52782 type:complete len:437 (-) Transcript_31971:466-1776(-)|eukprot:CAMPEP_0119022130 /NCGR_PEP_ID=MMETSP1176-20130426/27383_1 /TAXON_ID=265551 /ORGANISM="Synedropsis recta cf, Strain CCMP1620" /LENGTH=436 /DNA_ID=CAMNT_0006976889 /DNA_START=59 /DNA_END=1369 /DNA_ORIENTATION=-